VNSSLPSGPRVAAPVPSSGLVTYTARRHMLLAGQCKLEFGILTGLSSDHVASDLPTRQPARCEPPNLKRKPPQSPTRLGRIELYYEPLLGRDRPAMALSAPRASHATLMGGARGRQAACTVQRATGGCQRATEAATEEVQPLTKFG
jgi:hypothetical protein